MICEICKDMLIPGNNYPDRKFTYGRGICDDCWKETPSIPVHIPMKQKARYLIIRKKKGKLVRRNNNE